MIPAWGAVFAAALLGSAAAAETLPQVVVGLLDYPDGLAPPRTEKRVVAAYVSAPGGRTERCSIVESSRDRGIDRATCDILVRRARFAPAGEQRIVFRWQGRVPVRGRADLERRGDPLLVNRMVRTSLDYPAGAAARLEQGDVAFEIDVSPMGAAVRCRVTEPSASAELNQWTCPYMMNQAVFIPSVDAEGRTVAGTYRSRISWRIR